MRRHLSGTFLTRARGGGAWRLSRGGPQPADIFLRGTGADAAVFDTPEVQDIGIEWRAGAATLHLMSAGLAASATVKSAIVHEPLPRLYEALPLVALDADAQRFWRWIFRLVRIPGGRLVLGLLTRRNRFRD